MTGFPRILAFHFAFCILNFALLSAADDKNNVPTVPPPGVEPFNPKPLMDKLNERIKTDVFKFAVLGDAKHAKTLPGLLKYLDETVSPDFVLTTGDMVASGGGKVGPGYYEMLSKEAGEQMRKRPWWPAIGNHELAGGAITGKDALKDDSEKMRANQASGIANFKQFYALDNDYYSFTFRNGAFIALPFRYPTGKQVEWLESELKKASEAKLHIFVFNHAPFFTVGNKPAKEVPNKETDVTALFQKYGVKAVFSGHDHGYYRTVRGGIPYFTSAGGGAAIYPATRAKEALPEDVYYYGVASSFLKGAEKEKEAPLPGSAPEPEKKTDASAEKPAATGGRKYALHKNDGSPDTITETPEQFLCVVEVNGNKIVCRCITAKGETWDEIQLSK
ncbi:MAG TPA: metallophosphoesterase [Planctomycetota bacterium]|nr:metallophosphoesterase [Planctomycetota bacterium]